MLSTIRHIIFTVSIFAISAPFVQAQELKIGYVNTERVMRESAVAKAALGKLEAEFGRRDKELTDLAAKLKSGGDRLEKDGVTMAESERNRRQRELVEQDRELQRKRREFQEDLNVRRNELMGEVIERANRTIRQIHDSEKYDFILQEVVTASSRVDITDKVIKALNSQAGAK